MEIIHFSLADQLCGVGDCPAVQRSGRYEVDAKRRPRQQSQADHARSASDPFSTDRRLLLRKATSQGGVLSARVDYFSTEAGIVDGDSHPQGPVLKQQPDAALDQALGWRVPPGL